MALGDLISTLGADPLSGQTDLSSPKTVERQRLLAAALMKEGADYSPIRSPWQGAARLANALMGSYQNYRADEAERAGKEDLSKEFGSLFTGQQPQATGAVTTTTAPSPQGSGDFLPAFAQAGTRHGISPAYLSRTAQIESGMNPQAHNASGADGLMQFVPSTARQYGLTNPRDPNASIDAAARLAADNKRVLVASLGRNPTDAELYLAHQQGAVGASKLLANPNAPAANIVGKQAVIQNGGRPDMTAGEFSGMWLNKFGGAPAQTTAAPVQTAQAAPQIDTQKLMAVMQNPWATPAQQQIAGDLLKRELGKGTPDPVVVGNRIVDKNTGKVTYESPERPKDKAASIQEYEYAKANGFKGSFEDWKNPKKGAELSDEDASFMADRVIAGDTSVLVGLGRGAQGADNIAKVQHLVGQKAKTAGIDPNDILANRANVQGMNAEQRTFGTQTARMATASTEAEGALKLGREASAAVPRGNWVPVNKAIQSIQAGSSDPNLARFAAANMTIINTYARAINPNGVPHLADKVAAGANLISTATSHEAYLAALDQIQKEIDIAHQAPTRAKTMMEDIRKGKTPEAGAAAPKQKRYRYDASGNLTEQ